MNTITKDTQAAGALGAVTYNPDERWWQPDPATRIEAKQVSRALDVDELIALRLVMLGRDAQGVTDYLYPAPAHIVLPEETCPGMNAAAKALMAGIEAGEKIAIFADYDVDGQTSLAIISDTIEHYGGKIHLGTANAKTGFGLTRAFVEEAHADGCKWLITVDCGSTQIEPVKLAQSLGMRVIVIDHHDVDADNPADHHLNPRRFAVYAMQQLAEMVEQTKSRQQLLVRNPYIDQVEKLTDKTWEKVFEAFGRERPAELVETVKRFGDPANTGAVLTWKFCAELHRVRLGHTPDEHWGRPMYLAGLGAIADLAPCDEVETRAFVRVPNEPALQRIQFGNTNVVPAGVRVIADMLGEEPARPDTLMRTRALLNLPKRTSEINPADIQRVLRARKRTKQLVALCERLVADYERLSAIRREQMDPICLQQVSEYAAQVAAGEKPDTYFAYAIVDGFEDYAGFARMCANTLVKQTGKPAVVFVRKATPDTDPFGQTLYKFSGANDVCPDVKLGELIDDEALREACVIRQYDWLGEEADIPNLGGHLEVVSGVVREENLGAAIAAFEAWAADKDDKRKWKPIDRDARRPRVIKRRISEQRLARLEREAGLLAPFSFPTNPAPQVSVIGRLRSLKLNPDDERWHGLLETESGILREVVVTDEVRAAVAAAPKATWEVVLALGGVGPYLITKVVRVR